MLNQEMVKRLSKEQRVQLDKLEEEYNKASKAINGKRFPNKEQMKIYGDASQKLATFYTQHGLLK